MAETWFILEDGSYADPADVSEKDGVWQKDGVAVAFGAHGNPLTRSMYDADLNAARRPKAKEVEAEKPATYRTREVKSKD